MRKSNLTFLLCAVLIFCFLSGCTASNVHLTEDQEARIDLIVQNRNEWKEVSELAASYPTNRLHIAETSDGITIITVAHVREGTGTDKGWQTYVVNGYAANNSVFTAVNSYHEDWIVDCVSVDLENMSDSELKEAVKDSYIKFLSKN